MQAPMNPMSSAGIQSLMSGMSQGKPVPPSAAVGSVADRVKTYAPNPEALNQQLQISPALMDALALEQLRSMQQAAKNDIALKTDQQGTVIQQREQELLEGIKSQMTLPQQAQQSAGIAQQQAQQKQEAMQRLTQGIAKAPGAQEVMPARMAQGGVVGFAGGGEPTQEDYRDARRYGIVLSPNDPPEVKAQKLEQLQRARNMRKDASEPVLAGEPQGQTRKLPGLAGEPQGQTQKLPGLAGEPQGQTQKLPMRRPLLPPSSDRGLPQVLPPAGSGIRLPEQPTPLPAGGIASVGTDVAQGSALPGMMQTPPAQSGELDLPAILKQTGVDPAEMAKSRETAAKSAYGISPEEKEILDARLARLREEGQPKKTAWYERLAELSRNMPKQGSPSNIGTLGDISRAAGAMDEAARIKRKENQAAIDALQDKLMETQRGARGKAFEAGTEAQKTGLTAQTGLAQAGAGIYGTNVGRRAEEAKLAAQQGMFSKELAQKEMLANLDAETRLQVARIQASASKGDDKAKYEEMRLKQILSDPLLEELAKRAAAEPAQKAAYNTHFQEQLRKFLPQYANKDSGSDSRKPMPAGQWGKASVVTPTP